MLAAEPVIEETPVPPVFSQHQMRCCRSPIVWFWLLVGTQYFGFLDQGGRSLVMDLRDDEPVKIAAFSPEPLEKKDWTEDPLPSDLEPSPKLLWKKSPLPPHPTRQDVAVAVRMLKQQGFLDPTGRC